MRLRISHSAAVTAAFAAASARIFIALAVDDAAIHNGAWIAALLGALPAAPYLLGLDRIRKARTARCLRAPLALLLLCATALDAAAVLSVIVRTSGYLALDHVPAAGLSLPVSLAALWCVWRNGDAVGNAARLWTRLFPALLLAVVLLQARHYRPEWLFPLLGNGCRDIVRGAVRTAGRFVPVTSILLVTDAPDDSTDRPGARRAPVLCAAGIVAAALLALRLMMAPTGVHATQWLMRLDALLTNGRAPLYLQLPMILLWYIALLHLLTCECFAASALLQRLLPALNGHLCAAAVAVGCTALSGFGKLDSLKDGAAPWLFIAAAALVALTMVFKGGERPCTD